MLKIRLQRTKNDIRWFIRLLQRDKRLDLENVSTFFNNAGTERYKRVYAEVYRKSEDSDVDVVIEYYGSEKEDSLFNILNEEGLSIGGRNIDMNPITKDKSGTLETYLPEVERYLAEKAQSMEQPSRDMAGDIAKEQEKEEKREKDETQKERPEKHKTGKFANFSMQKSDDSEKYYLFADIKYPSGDIERHKPIAEFPDKKESEAFCKSRGITCDDVTDNLENVIRHKKQVASEKGKTSPSRETGRKHGDIGDE